MQAYLFMYYYSLIRLCECVCACARARARMRVLPGAMQAGECKNRRATVQRQTERNGKAGLAEESRDM